MNPYATTLNLPFTPFKNGAHPNDLYKTIIKGIVRVPYKDVPLSDINPELINFFSNRGLELFIAELFSKLPNPSRMQNRIHSGAGGEDDATKVNWVWGGTDSVMTWYRKKENATASEEGFNAAGSKIVYYTDLELENPEPVYRHKLGLSGTMIQIGVPHAVENTVDERWALTTVYRDSSTKEIVKYNDLYNRLKDVVKSKYSSEMRLLS